MGLLTALAAGGRKKGGNPLFAAHSSAHSPGTEGQTGSTGSAPRQAPAHRPQAGAAHTSLVQSSPPTARNQLAANLASFPPPPIPPSPPSQAVQHVCRSASQSQGRVPSTLPALPVFSQHPVCNPQPGGGAAIGREADGPFSTDASVAVTEEGRSSQDQHQCRRGSSGCPQVQPGSHGDHQDVRYPGSFGCRWGARC